MNPDEILQSCNKCNPNDEQTIYQVAELLEMTRSASKQSDIGTAWYFSSIEDPLFDRVSLFDGQSHSVILPTLMLNAETQTLLLHRAATAGQLYHGGVSTFKGVPKLVITPNFLLVMKYFNAHNEDVQRAMRKNEDDRQFLFKLASAMHGDDPNSSTRLYNLAVKL